MLTRVYIDNYLCFVNFEYRPERKELIFGGNGSGKSSFCQTLMTIRRFLLGEKVDDCFPVQKRSRYSNGKGDQHFELDVLLNDRLYEYSLSLIPNADDQRTIVHWEALKCDSKDIFKGFDGIVMQYKVDDETVYLADPQYKVGPHRSAFETIDENDYPLLTPFKNWLQALFYCKINPYSMKFSDFEHDVVPNDGLSNFVAWYRHLINTDPKQEAALRESLSACLDSFKSLDLQNVGGNVRVLLANFEAPNGEIVSFNLTELSEGQRCLIALYTILHFVIAKGNTVILDEPDNFLSLREIQPWLMAVADLIDDDLGQVIVISHHPEIIDQWGPGSGVQFLRDGVGRVTVKKFVGKEGNGVHLSELIASGWEND